MTVPLDVANGGGPPSGQVKSAVPFFFSSRRRHTRYIGDWSSDVCSSDLAERGGRGGAPVTMRSRLVGSPDATRAVDWEQRIDFPRLRRERLDRAKAALEASDQIGRASCRDRGEGSVGAGAVSGPQVLGSG